MIVRNKGFSLIEMIIYVGLVATVILALTNFLPQIIEVRIKNNYIAEVEEQGWQIMQIIKTEVNQAENILNITPGNSGNSLALESNNSVNPVIFGTNNGQLTLTKDGGSPIVLHSSLVKIGQLEFFNLSQSDTPGLIRIVMNLQSNTNSVRQEFNYEQNFITSAVIYDQN